MSVFVVNKLKELGTDTSRLKINMDWQHLIMNGEHLAEYAEGDPDWPEYQEFVKRVQATTEQPVS